MLRFLCFLFSAGSDLRKIFFAAGALSFVSSSDSLDWKDYDAATICSRVTGKVDRGSIALFHNAALHTPEALPDILESLIQKGLTVVPISQLIYWENYTIDHTGRQFPVSAGEG